MKLSTQMGMVPILEIEVQEVMRDGQGNTIYHTVKMPKRDERGNIIRDEKGKPILEDKTVPKYKRVRKHTKRGSDGKKTVVMDVRKGIDNRPEPGRP